MVLDDVESAWSLDIEVETLVSDAVISDEADCGRASSNKHAVWEAVVGNVNERSPLAAFLLVFAASSLSTTIRRGRGGRVRRRRARRRVRAR